MVGESNLKSNDTAYQLQLIVGCIEKNRTNEQMAIGYGILPHFRMNRNRIGRCDSVY